VEDTIFLPGVQIILHIYVLYTVRSCKWGKSFIPSLVERPGLLVLVLQTSTSINEPWRAQKFLLSKHNAKELFQATVINQIGLLGHALGVPPIAPPSAEGMRSPPLH
jgi:hypothetical protein